MECNFWIGQKVVCVDVSPSYVGLDCGLVEGAVYTIRGIRKYDEGIGVKLKEVETRADVFHVAAWRAERFRPAVERTTDISIFRRILKDIDSKVKKTEEV